MFPHMNTLQLYVVKVLIKLAILRQVSMTSHDVFGLPRSKGKYFFTSEIPYCCYNIDNNI